ncbi:translation initiation factor IF-2 [Streptomyces sp. NPDC088124]|uniref:translation initiation factor IF-2 n=1 Tax=Streptomyces sp. NPDC088124 TaxID=3154654 RepID=UPI00343ABCB3
MRRLLLLAPLLLLTVGCGVVQSSEDEATDAARVVARKAGERLYGQRPRTVEEVGRSASGIDGVEVLRVTGTSTHDGNGVDVVVRTSGSAYNRWRDLEEVTLRRCFTVRVSPKSEWREDPRDVNCPDGPLLTVAPPPEPSRLPYEEFRAKLPRVLQGGRVEEAEVRRTLAALDLHPAIRTEVKADGGRIGVLLPVGSGQWLRRAGLPPCPRGPRCHRGVGTTPDPADARRGRLHCRQCPGPEPVTALN